MRDNQINIGIGYGSGHYQPVAVLVFVVYSAAYAVLVHEAVAEAVVGDVVVVVIEAVAVVGLVDLGLVMLSMLYKMP